jgi:SAM-dependent methyltransferase
MGQFSWTTADEFRRFFRQLELTAESHVLDVACGSGGPALFTAQITGCPVTGIDVNESGISTARQTAAAPRLQDRVCFECADAGQPLPFPDASFDAIISIDAMNHLYNRAEVLAEWRRVLRPGGRFLFTDAVIVSGILSRDEILARSSSMGQFLFTPAGDHERIIEAAGFIDLQVEDVTNTIAFVAKRWYDERAKHRTELLKTESQADFDSLQGMLNAAHTLAAERRLSRFAYCARKPSST